ncbi:O-acetylserine/cysteine efflux transporter [Amycolatopsis bartoniae]|uniref:Membrane protein n=1 Tax=Amycolatopsis bartoniae TaxID=941986 RepID=A0A8H9IWJ5_9PSEU|nr:EamA family transporter [Amycolatopsis bartoniae]MBB2935235.1 O-acetylserine/cysteine efflux transporter [Amycolatopsis bartoniae]TVT04057.1 EamA family transporter [Amycolatopsis bartoniae]GHF75294.1 membrane protein [Amycolatopsis bartoniae]
MSARDRLLALFVAVLWGCNFLAVHYTLGHFPPLFTGALRFLVIAIPTMLFVPRPKVKLRWLIGFGLGFGTGQFAFLFLAMNLGMPTGLASLVLQASAPLTVLLGSVFLRERLTPRQLGGILLAVGGMAVIAWHQAEHAVLLPVVLTLLGALSWAVGNVCARQARPENGLHFTLWMSVVPPIPMLALSLVFEGPAADWHSLATLNTANGWTAIGGFGYVVVLGTLVGSGVWTTLMNRNPANIVAPFSLLVPVVGMSASFLLLDERPALVEVLAGVVVVGGVLLGSLPRRQRSAEAVLAVSSSS